MTIWQVIFDNRVVYESEFKSMAVIVGELSRTGYQLKQVELTENDLKDNPKKAFYLSNNGDY